MHSESRGTTEENLASLSLLDLSSRVIEALIDTGFNLSRLTRLQVSQRFSYV